jgi:predicted HTH transcriptional regulator
MAIKDNLSAADPLSNEALQKLIAYKEEDLYVDYKESFDHKNNKQWLEITKDVMAFANTQGGYIVIGVRHKPFIVIGLEDSIVDFLAETNNILQKVNRYISPSFTNIRTKKYKTEDGNIVVIHIPESKGRTHIVVKEASYKYPDGRTEMVLRPGMIYVRRSATNNVMTPDDLEFILARRLDYYKESLFNRISRVVQAPIEHELVFLDANDVSKRAKGIRISDDPDATEVKGLNIAVPPKNDQQEIAGWIAMRARNERFSPGSERLWYIYSNRLTLKDTLTDDQIAELMRFNLLNNIPTFYWMQFVDDEKCKNIIKEWRYN